MKGYQLLLKDRLEELKKLKTCKSLISYYENMIEKFKKEHRLVINEYQRQFLSKLVSDYIKINKKKNFPISQEVEQLDLILLLD